MDIRGNRLAGVVLIVAGTVGLLYGGFSYVQDTHKATLGSVELSVNERQTVNIPVWAGVALLVVGGVLVLSGGRKL